MYPLPSALKRRKLVLPEDVKQVYCTSNPIRELVLPKGLEVLLAGTPNPACSAGVYFFVIG